VRVIRRLRVQEEPAVVVQLEVEGELRIVAIGGETTGTEISDHGITWDFDFCVVMKVDDLRLADDKRN